MQTAIRYTILAMVATAANLLAQDLTVRFPGLSNPVLTAVAVGTAVGLIVKYLLDKFYIFRFKADDKMHESRTFATYVGMAIATTVIFWAFEWGFYVLFETHHMRYVGAVIGLAIGYTCKYQLDKRYVFRT